MKMRKSNTRKGERVRVHTFCDKCGEIINENYYCIMKRPFLNPASYCKIGDMCKNCFEGKATRSER